MNWRSLTMIILGVVLALLIGYDVLAIVQGGTEASISDVIYTTSLKRPILPFAVGFICGHFFWGQRSA